MMKNWPRPLEWSSFYLLIQLHFPTASIFLVVISSWILLSHIRSSLNFLTSPMELHHWTAKIPEKKSLVVMYWHLDVFRWYVNVYSICNLWFKCHNVPGLWPCVVWSSKKLNYKVCEIFGTGFWEDWCLKSKDFSTWICFEIFFNKNKRSSYNWHKQILFFCDLRLKN